MLDLCKPMHQPYWKILARLQGTNKLKMSQVATGRLVKETQQKKKRGEKKNETNESYLTTFT